MFHLGDEGQANISLLAMVDERRDCANQGLVVALGGQITLW